MEMLMNVINKFYSTKKTSSGQSFKFIKHFRHLELNKQLEFLPKSPHLIKTNNREIK